MRFSKFLAVLTGDLEAIAKLPLPELEKILVATLIVYANGRFMFDAQGNLWSGEDVLISRCGART